MEKYIQTLHPDYMECILDIDIFGKIVGTPQQSLEEMKETLFEEFKLRTPMPTLESKRYELSRQVSPDYFISYNGEPELQDNEALVDLPGGVSRMPPIDFTDLSPLIDEVKDCFRYEDRVTDDYRQMIITKFDLETGDEFKPGVRQTENIVGSVQEDSSLYLSDEQIDALGEAPPGEEFEELAESVEAPVAEPQPWGSALPQVSSSAAPFVADFEEGIEVPDGFGGSGDVTPPDEESEDTGYIDTGQDGEGEDSDDEEDSDAGGMFDELGFEDGEDSEESGEDASDDSEDDGMFDDLDAYDGEGDGAGSEDSEEEESEGSGDDYGDFGADSDEGYVEAEASEESGEDSEGSDGDYVGEDESESDDDVYFGDTDDEEEESGSEEDGSDFDDFGSIDVGSEDDGADDFSDIDVGSEDDGSEDESDDFGDIDVGSEDGGSDEDDEDFVDVGGDSDGDDEDFVDVGGDSEDESDDFGDIDVGQGDEDESDESGYFEDLGSEEESEGGSEDESDEDGYFDLDAGGSSEDESSGDFVDISVNVDVADDGDDFEPEFVPAPPPVRPQARPQPPPQAAQPSRPTAQFPHVSQQAVVQNAPTVIDRSAEPTDLRQFVRKHPRCSIQFALQYFTKKQIDTEVRLGRVIHDKKKGILR